MTLEEEIRIASITHIHEASVKSELINKMLRDFYKEVLRVADREGIRLSVLTNFNEQPLRKEEEMFQ